MKILSARIHNFKRFSPPGLDISLRADETTPPWDRFLVLGDNGTGKTTLLQAIALTLSLAQRKTERVDLFRWTGWVPERYGRWGDPNLDLEVSFDSDEIAATKEVARLWYNHFYPAGGQGFVEPGDSGKVTLHLRGGRVEAASLAELYQFRGRAYAGALTRYYPEVRKLFRRLPGVFWYDQYRNIALPGEREVEDQAPPTFAVGVVRLRDVLRTWQVQRDRLGPHPDQDFLGELEGLYRIAFPGRTFAGLEPIYGEGPTPYDSSFVFSDGARTYELGEMSAGEQSVFPILFEFVRQQVHRSVVLIDEVDLNLHPPLAQRVISLLPRLGEQNQFVFTTHSSAVATMVSPRATFRLPGGQLCL